jgi:release factor glutamine methyltransferase
MLVTTEQATLGATLARARARLAAAGVADPATDARLIVEHFSGTSRRDAVVEPERQLGDAALAAIDAALVRRSAGEPVHRILGFREFYGLRFGLSPATLEPRPDTETLVDAMLPLARERVRKNGGCRILDLGTGTGALALALLANVPEAAAVGTDISPEALVTAAGNAAGLGLGNRFFPVDSDWWEKIDGVFDVIVSNPPYIESQTIETLSSEVRDFDPRAALDGGADGLDAYRSIASGAARHLSEGGAIGLEIGAGQREQVAALFAKTGFALAAVHRDLGGHDRAMIFVR